MTHDPRCLFPLLMLLGLSATSPLLAQLETKVFASDGADVVEQQFGHSVGIDQGVAIVGVDGSAALEYTGAVYIFRSNGLDWMEEQHLIGPSTGPWDGFGHSVAISGDHAIVGAFFDMEQGSFAGAAYSYRYDGNAWVQEQKLLASDGSGGGWFGASVSIDGDVVVIGANQEDTNGIGAGAVYVFRRSGDTWVEEQKIVASDGSYGDWFGWSAAITDDLLIVGARNAAGTAGLSGAAYAYRYDGTVWADEQKLTASDGVAGDWFGESVAISGDAILIGASGVDNLAIDSGAAYVFRMDGTLWIEEQKLVALDGGLNDEFGLSVDIAGDLATVGAHRHVENGIASGAAYVFHFDGTSWNEVFQLQGSDAAPQDSFGRSVGVASSVVVSGAPLDDDLGDQSGSVSFFRVPYEEFLRGDCDGDGSVNGFIDGATALLIQFLPGTPDAPCTRACDANGDGSFNGLSDGLLLLNFTFVPGSPPPAFPFPDCGLDQTSPIPCDFPPSVCP